MSWLSWLLAGLSWRHLGRIRTESHIDRGMMRRKEKGFNQKGVALGSVTTLLSTGNDGATSLIPAFKTQPGPPRNPPESWGILFCDLDRSICHTIPTLWVALSHP